MNHDENGNFTMTEKSARLRLDRNSSTGYFPPDSMLRRMSGEAVALLGGGYAILLQLAHPYIAAGVDDYSAFQSNILARLYRTVYFMHRIVFADKEQVHRVLEKFHAGHDRIRGQLGDRAGNFSPEKKYAGSDPKAKLWVHATMVDAGLKTYELFIRPLTTQERRSYYNDTLLQARLLKIPEEILPQSLEEFQEYMEQMLTGNTLAVTEAARRLGHAVLYPDVGLLPQVSAWLLRIVTAGLLPAPFRKAYGLRWGRGRAFLFRSFSRMVRTLRPVAPRWIWQSPLHGGKLLRFMLWGNEGPPG